jgi:putative toxin-antitoxin system antitoxin component (TIGR02293 family)
MMAGTTRTKRRRKGVGGRPYQFTLDLPALDTAELILHIKEGFPIGTLDVFVERTGFAREVVARAMQLPQRTLSRRKDEGRLHPDESDRLVRIARIFELVLQLFEDNVDMARAWLTAAQPALRGSTPLEYASTEVGSREVEALIGRLEHGIPS